MQVRFYAALRDVVGTRRVDVPVEEKCSVRAVLQDVTGRYPALGAKLWNEQGALSGLVAVLVNGRALHTIGGLDTLVTEADTVDLFPPVGGG